MLLRRESLDVADAVRRGVGLQAQEAASPYLALWNRLDGFDPADLDAAFASFSVVKATLMRITLHAVHAEDYPEFHNVMLPHLRGARLLDRRFTATGLSVDDADALLPRLAEFVARPRTGAEIEDLLTTLLRERKERVWWALRTFAPLHHVPSGGAWSFGGTRSFVAAGAKPGPACQLESVQKLLLRYLEAFGPASAQDFCQFTLLSKPVVQHTLSSLDGKLEELRGPGKAVLFDVPGAWLPGGDIAAPPRLLPMWDSILLAYRDRGRVVPPEYRTLIFRRNGDVLPAVLADGYVAGVWRVAEGGVEVTAFRRLDGETWRGLATEAGALMAFLADRDRAVYRRYAHWWDKDMPSAEVRVLG
jgi:Winged helix DNA-binding domain